MVVYTEGAVAVMDAHNFAPSVQRDAKSYRERLGKINFINAYCQITDVLRFSPANVLIIGNGLGLEAIILRSFGIAVTVVDIDECLGPDVVASADDLSAFQSGQFDVVIASHVLEHLPFKFFDQCLSEIGRVGKHALIYLPFACLVFQANFGILPLTSSALWLRLPLFWKRHRFDGEHYWEIGVAGRSLKLIRRHILKTHFVVDEYHNRDWRYSYNFILKSKHTAGHTQ